MCGIAGIFDSHTHPNSGELLPMVQIMTHRGPDHEGTLVTGPIALGMRRLSIIDLDTGNQPIQNHDQSVSVIANGEIYNYLELRVGLEEQGYQFKTQTDTEVLVHLYTEYGQEMLPKLNGMFAFAIWDNKLQSLFIARDRMGIKPLYYTQVGDRFLFASELKSITTQKNIDKSLNENAISDYLRLGYIPRSATPYQSIHKLLPGYFLKVNEKQVHCEQWWDLKKPHTPDQEMLEDFDSRTMESFDHSIKLRMRSDVPVASFLSGGLDSSIISATASKMSQIEFQTYNVKFDDTVFDESPYAQLVAEQNGTDHHHVAVSATDVLEKLPLLVWHMDEPNADSAIIPNFLVSEFAAKNVKVCLSGLGGDELFGGYSRYVDKPLGPYRQFFKRFPWIAWLALPLIRLFSPGNAKRIYPYTGKKHHWRTYLNQIQLFDTYELRKLGLKQTGQTENLIRTLWNEYPGSDAVGQRQFIDQHTYLPDQILALTDRMSMAVSLEVRVPFLDHHLIGQAANLSGEKKQSATGEFKIWLKNTLGIRVPEELLHRKKWGFAGPVENWISNNALADIIQTLPQLLSGLLNEKYIRLLVENKEDPRYHTMMWRLLILAIWLKVSGMSKKPEKTIDQLFE